MGWWDTAVLGGDPALDVIDRIEQTLGYDNLYPLTAVIEHPEREAIAEALGEYGLATLDAAVVDSMNPEISTQVVAVLAMATGAPLGEFAEQARAAARADQWANDARESNREARSDTMAALIATIDDYDGTPVVTPSHTGGVTV